MDDKVLKLGAYAQDKITGFSGTLTGYCTYLSGFDRALIEAKAMDGKSAETEWFDVSRVVAVDVPVE